MRNVISNNDDEKETDESFTVELYSAEPQSALCIFSVREHTLSGILQCEGNCAVCFFSERENVLYGGMHKQEICAVQYAFSQ